MEIEYRSIERVRSDTVEHLWLEMLPLRIVISNNSGRLLGHICSDEKCSLIFVDDRTHFYCFANWTKVRLSSITNMVKRAVDLQWIGVKPYLLTKFFKLFEIQIKV